MLRLQLTRYCNMIRTFRLSSTSNLKASKMIETQLVAWLSTSTAMRLHRSQLWIRLASTMLSKRSLIILLSNSFLRRGALLASLSRVMMSPRANRGTTNINSMSFSSVGRRLLIPKVWWQTNSVGSNTRRLGKSLYLLQLIQSLSQAPTWLNFTKIVAVCSTVQCMRNRHSNLISKSLKTSKKRMLISQSHR